MRAWIFEWERAPKLKHDFIVNKNKNRQYLPTCFDAIKVLPKWAPKNPKLRQTELVRLLYLGLPHIYGGFGSIVLISFNISYRMLSYKRDIRPRCKKQKAESRKQKGYCVHNNTRSSAVSLAWWPLWLIRSGWADLGLGTVLCFFLPYLLAELALRTSSSFVLLIGMVSWGHFPFTCHNWVIGIDLSLESETLSTSKSPSGWKLGLVWPIWSISETK